MIKANNRIRHIILIIIIFAGIFIIVFLIRMKLHTPKSVWSEFEDALIEKERVVDGIQEGETAYLIISQEDRSDYGNKIAIFHMNENEGWKRVYENDFTGIKPWKLELADIDGDGVKEIVTAVRKATHYDETEKNRMFIFNYENGKLIKKWTGSQIAGTWKDFIVGDFLSIRGNELIFISEQTNGQECINIYYWFDFGFLKLAESEDFDDILTISIQKENRLGMTCEVAGKKEDVTLLVKDGKIIQATKDSFMDEPY